VIAIVIAERRREATVRRTSLVPRSTGPNTQSYICARGHPFHVNARKTRS